MFRCVNIINYLIFEAKMSREVFEKIKQLLDTNKAIYKILEHEPTPTSEKAAEVRERLAGISKEQALKQGAKAMILRSHGKFYQFVLSAEKKIDFNKAKKLLNTDSVSLATPEQVQEITDCVPGAVPPFGNLFNIQVYVDKSLLQYDDIDFNAGEQTISIFMKKNDWVKIVKPTEVDFSK